MGTLFLALPGSPRVPCVGSTHRAFGLAARCDNARVCKTIMQKVRFKAEPADVYTHLVSDTDEVGRRFALGTATGLVVDLAPGERVVRAWREADYPEGVFSMAAVTLRRITTGTELTLIHRGVPKGLIPRTEERWRREHWDAIRAKLR